MELPVVEVSGSGGDDAFLLEDDSYLHYEFETGYHKESLIRYAGYDLRLFERDGRIVRTVVIYSSDVKEAPPPLCIGSLTYNPDVILMGDYDGREIYAQLDAKIKAGQELTDVDMLNLTFLPLMRHSIPRQELAANSIKLAQSIADTAKRNACIAAAYALASKYLNEEETENLLEVLKMNDLMTLFLEEALEEAEKRVVERAEKKREIEIAKNFLRLNMVKLEDIAAATGMDMDVLHELKKELGQ